MECRSDGDYAGRPLAVHWQEQRLVVAVILNRWSDPRGKGFRVRTENGKVFDLLYDAHLDNWELSEIV